MRLDDTALEGLPPDVQRPTYDRAGDRTASAESASSRPTGTCGTGVQLVGRAEPYEVLTLRLLNAGHQALGYLGRLAGHRFVHEAVADPALAAFYRAYADEVAPTLPAVAGVDVTAYRDELVERFGNAAIGDSLGRICAYSSDRIPKFVLPAVQENLTAGRDVRFAAAVVAAWARYCEGSDEQGAPIELLDPRADELREAARAERTEPLAFLAFLASQAQLADFMDQRAFTEPYLATLRALHTDGVRATLAALTGSS